MSGDKVTNNFLNVTLITLGDPGKLTGGYLYHYRMARAAPCQNANMHFISFPERRFPLPTLAAKTVLDQALRCHPDALLVDSIVAAYFAPLVLRLRSRPPLCAVVHQSPGGVDHGPLRRRLQSALDLALYRRAQRVIVPSVSASDELCAFGIDRQRLRIVPPGVDPPAVSSCALDLRRGRPIALLCVANWLPNKGINILLDAFALLPKDIAILHLVGDPYASRRYGHHIAKRLASPALKNRVYAHGRLPAGQLAAFYRSADVFVLPSQRESYGQVYAEAMSAGLPVVALNVGNVPYLVSSGENGLLVPIADVRALADAMLLLASEGDTRAQMGRAARERAAQLPSWEESARDFFRVIRDLVDDWGGVGAC